MREGSGMEEIVKGSGRKSMAERKAGRREVRGGRGMWG
jgi:hypothetical protein